MFGKKATAEAVMKLFSALSDEEKARFLEGVKPKTENEKQIAEAETDIADKGEGQEEAENAAETEGAGETEKSEESEPALPAEETPAKSDSADSVYEERAEEMPQETAPEADAQTQENREVVFDKLAERVSALETALQEFTDLKAKMEAYTAKQADSFGYNGKVFSGNKSIDDMSAEELKGHILQGK